VNPDENADTMDSLGSGRAEGPDAPDSGDGSKGTIGGFLARHAVDVRPVALPAFRRLLIGQGASAIGSMLTAVAVLVEVFRINNSSLDVGIASMAGLLPIVVLGMYGGAIVDAFDRRRILIIASLVSWVMTILLLVQALLQLENLWLICGIVAAQSGSFAVSASANGAIVPRVVERSMIAAANTLSYTLNTVGQVVGPLIAGALIVFPNGVAYAYGVDALLFTASLYAAFRLPPIPVERSDSGETARQPVPGLRSVLDGLRFLGKRPVLLMAFALDVIVMVFAMPRALFPEIAEERFPGGVGLLYSAIAIGALVAGMASGWIGRVRRQGRALMIAVAIWSLAICIAGLVDDLWVVVTLLAVAGAADLVSVVFRETILVAYTPDEMRGRLQGVYIVTASGGPRLGDLRAGLMAAMLGVTASWVVGGLISLVLVLAVGLSVRPFWKYDTARLGQQATGPRGDADD
jgi:MFS family permease